MWLFLCLFEYMSTLICILHNLWEPLITVVAPVEPHAIKQYMWDVCFLCGRILLLLLVRCLLWDFFFIISAWLPVNKLTCYMAVNEVTHVWHLMRLLGCDSDWGHRSGTFMSVIMNWFTLMWQLLRSFQCDSEGDVRMNELAQVWH